MKRLRRTVRPYDEAMYLAECYARKTQPSQPPAHHFKLWWIALTAPGAEVDAPKPEFPFKYTSLLHALRVLAAWRHVRVNARVLRAWVASCVHCGTPAPEDGDLDDIARLEHGLHLALQELKPIEQLPTLPEIRCLDRAPAPDVRRQAVELHYRHLRRIAEGDPCVPAVQVLQQARPAHVVQVARRQILHDDDPPQKALLALAQVHCALVGKCKFAFATRAVFFEFELTERALLAQAFPCILHRRGLFYVCSQGRAAHTNNAITALRMWLAMCPPKIDGRYDVLGI